MGDIDIDIYLIVFSQSVSIIQSQVILQLYRTAKSDIHYLL